MNITLNHLPIPQTSEELARVAVRTPNQCPHGERWLKCGWCNYDYDESEFSARENNERTLEEIFGWN